ncbi:MAG: hypothetical protein J6W81_08435 [Lentisphaeria bacterium]|nr:hypothetical protein [Lentisphaeria bacterium]
MEIDRKKILKKTGVIAAWIVGIILLLLILTPFIAPVIAKTSIKTVGSAITGVPMEMQSMSINPFTGKVSIKNLKVGNPKGYTSAQAFLLKDFFVDLDASSLLSKKLVIENIQIKGVEVNFETTLLSNNLSDIQNNVNKTLGIDPDKKSTKTDAAPAKQKPLQINHFEMSDITAWLVLKGTKAQAPIMLVPVTLNNLGTGPDGVSSAAVINYVLVSMLTSLAKVPGVDIAVKAVSDGVSAVGNFLGNAADAIIGNDSKKK